MRYLKQLASTDFVHRAGRCGAVGFSLAAPMNETVNYNYDDLGRLVKVEQKGDASSNATLQLCL